MFDYDTDMEADDIIARLGLAPHPEGGWFRETWRAPAIDGTRAAASAIHFLLKAGERSHWHRVDADEIWLWHAGAALTLHRAATAAGPAESLSLGANLAAGAQPQAVIPAGHWQAASTQGDWTLVSCIVAPAFTFEGFELAAADFEIPKA